MAAEAAGDQAGRNALCGLVAELVAELAGRGVVTSYGSVWRIVREAGITFKERR